MANIVYLFGAGASAQALPVVEKIPARLREFIGILESDEFQLPADSIPTRLATVTYNGVQNDLIQDLKWLLVASGDHASVDTFAKKLFLTRDNDNLKRLKLALSVFFIYEQIKNKPDSRYDTFYASILQGYATNFPKNIQVISWNYDYQFEKAYSVFSKKMGLTENQTILNVKEKFRRNDAYPNQFTIYKINGTTGLYPANGYYGNLGFIFSLEGPFSKELLQKIIVTYYDSTVSSSIESSLSFAWESELNHDAIFDLVASCVTDTDVLVVIGYSFPFFNRQVDRKILSAMPNLKKVYFQSPVPETIRERFEAVCDKNFNLSFVLKHDTTQFFLPNEL